MDESSIKQAFREMLTEADVDSLPTLYQAFKRGYQLAESEAKMDIANERAKIDGWRECAWEEAAEYERSRFEKERREYTEWTECIDEMPPLDELVLLVWHERDESCDTDRGIYCPIRTDFAKYTKDGFVIMHNESDSHSEKVMDLWVEEWHRVDNPLFWRRISVPKYKPRQKPYTFNPNVPRPVLTFQPPHHAITLRHEK
jgi:hypothetical protein